MASMVTLLSNTCYLRAEHDAEPGEPEDPELPGADGLLRADVAAVVLPAARGRGSGRQRRPGVQFNRHFRDIPKPVPNHHEMCLYSQLPNPEVVPENLSPRNCPRFAPKIQNVY